MSSDAEALYEHWAPESSPWSPWVKPVIFTEVQDTPESAPDVSERDVAWAPELTVEVVEEEAGYREAPTRDRVAATNRFALVIDLIGRDGVLEGLRLIERGYRPIPLYNGVSNGMKGYRAASIAETIAAGTPMLVEAALPPDAPPAFLLDRDRMSGHPIAGQFDGRWMVFREDFPSAAALRAQGITGVIVRSAEEVFSEDLTHVLTAWRGAGLTLEASYRAEPPVPLELPRPKLFRSLFRRARVLAGLRRSAGGGFGGIIPLPSSGGGGG